MKLLDLVLFGQFYNEAGIDGQLQLDVLLGKREGKLDKDTVLHMKEWLLQCSEVFDDYDLNADIAYVIEGIHKHLSTYPKEE